MPYFQAKAGNRIHYEQFGTIGPPIVLLHGLASSSRLWIRQIRGLQRFYQVYVIDFPGHGQSDKIRNYSLKELSEQLNEWMESIGLQNASFLAISLGCSVALDLAARHPEKVNKLILEGPVGGYHSWWHPGGWADILVFGSLPFLLKSSIGLFGPKATARWINTFGVNSQRSKRTLEKLQIQVDFRALRQLLWDSIHPPYVGALGKVLAPTLVLRGACDPMPHRFVDYIVKNLPCVKLLEVPDTRHLVALERPAYFNCVAMSFLSHSRSSELEPRKVI